MAYFTIGSAAKRHGWTVKVPAFALVTACDERLAYHKGRIEFWSKELARASETLKTEGIKIRTYEVSGGNRSEAVLDPTLSGRVSECEAALKSNKDSVNRFTAYRSLFTIAKDEMLDLAADDVLYFNLEGADVGGDGEDE